MVPSNIVLYSLRAQGYVYASGNYGTNVELAQTFTQAEAVEYAMRFINHEGASQLLPVDRDILLSIQGKK